MTIKDKIAFLEGQKKQLQLQIEELQRQLKRVEPEIQKCPECGEVLCECLTGNEDFIDSGVICPSGNCDLSARYY